jgi:hypothetical protein
VSVWQTDGAAWFADPTGDFVAKVSDSGEELARITGLGGPCAASVNQNDGSCWIACREGDRVMRFNASGEIQVDLSGFNMPNDVSCYSQDGSCWVADAGAGRVVKLSPNGVELLVIPVLAGMSVAADERNGDCWVGCSTKMIKYSAAGQKLREVGTVTLPNDLDVNPNDGSVVAADQKRVITFDSAGNQIWSVPGLQYASGVAFNQDDGSVWATDMLAKKFLHYSSSGAKILEITVDVVTPMGVDVYCG